MNPKPILRRCVSCRKLVDRSKLWKVTRDYQDGVVLEGGMGRSAYLCPNEDCLGESWRRKKLHKALRCQVPEEILEVLKKRLNPCINSDSEAR